MCRRHKETKYGKEGKKGRGMGWGACRRTVGRGGRQTDRWAEWGTRKEEWLVEREGQQLGRGRQRNGLTGGQREKGCEGRRVRLIWQVCGVEIEGLSVGQRCVSARYYSNRQVDNYRDEVCVQWGLCACL